MKKQKFILFVSAALFVLMASFVLIGSYYTSKIPFISTTGFYIDGIDYDDPDLISAWAESYNGQDKQQIHCYQQYRSSVDYIYQDWRKDLRFVLKADIVSLEMPDSIWNKIDTIWFKTGKSVIKYDKNKMLDDWICTKTDSLIKFTSGQSQIPINTFQDGFQSFWDTKLLYVFKVNHLVLTALILAVCLFLFYFRYEFRLLLKRNCQNMRIKITKNKIFWAKLFVIVAGIITAFILVEVSLRILGYYHNKKHIVKNFTVAINTENTIICLGDSFTEGYGSSKGNAYPDVLQNLLNSESQINYIVANFGQSGKNTTQIKDEFFRYLDNHTPELVVLMAGSANYWNYYGFEDHNKFIYQIRTFKLIKLLWNELFVKTKFCDYTRPLFYTEEDYVKNRSEFHESIKNNSTGRSLMEPNDTLSFYSDRDLIYHKILYDENICSDTAFVSDLSTDLQQLYYIAVIAKVGEDVSINYFNSDYFRALYYYAKSFLVNAELRKKYLYLSVNEFPYLEDVYYQLLRSNYILPVLPKDFNQNRVCIADSMDFYRVKFGEEIDVSKLEDVKIVESNELNIETKKINIWVKNDLEDIILRCREKGIKIILMTYPFKYEEPLYWPVNDIIRELSVLYNIKLIDNFEIFKKNNSDTETLYVSDGHCNNKGYELMSKEVFNVLKKEKLLKGLNNTDVE